MKIASLAELDGSRKTEPINYLGMIQEMEFAEKWVDTMQQFQTASTPHLDHFHKETKMANIVFCNFSTSLGICRSSSEFSHLNNLKTIGPKFVHIAPGPKRG